MCLCRLLDFQQNKSEDLPADVKSLLLAEVSRYNSGFPVERIFKHLSSKRSQHELSMRETGFVFVTYIQCTVTLEMCMVVGMS